MSQREDALRVLFYELKAVSECLPASVQNDAPTADLILNLADAKLRIKDAIGKAAKVLDSLDELGGFAQ